MHKKITTNTYKIYKTSRIKHALTIVIVIIWRSILLSDNACLMIMFSLCVQYKVFIKIKSIIVTLQVYGKSVGL